MKSPSKKALTKKDTQKPQNDATLAKMRGAIRYVEFMQKCQSQKNGDQFVEFMDAMMVQIEKSFDPRYRKSWQVLANYNLVSPHGRLWGFISECMPGGPNNEGGNYEFSARFGKDTKPVRVRAN